GPGHRGTGDRRGAPPGGRAGTDPRVAPGVRGGSGGTRAGADGGHPGRGPAGAHLARPVAGRVPAGLLRERAPWVPACGGRGGTVTVPPIRVGTRASNLAQTQTATVVEALAATGLHVRT